MGETPEPAPPKRPSNPSIPQSPGAEQSFQPPSPHRAFAYWAKRLLACNPFYLLSAALLLYGCYRISIAIEPGIKQHNSFHLYFNF